MAALPSPPASVLVNKRGTGANNRRTYYYIFLRGAEWGLRPLNEKVLALKKRNSAEKNRGLALGGGVGLQQALFELGDEAGVLEHPLHLRGIAAVPRGFRER